MVLLIAFATGTQAFGAPDPSGEEGKVGRMATLSESIASEAIHGEGKGSAPPAALEKASGLVAGSLANGRQGKPTLRDAESLLPTVPFSFEDGIFGSLSPSSSRFGWSGYSQRFNLDLGMGYYRPGHGAGSMTGTAAIWL